MGAILTLIARLVLPVSILRWPLAGGVACMLLDGVDVVLIYFIGEGGFPGAHGFFKDHYTSVDKVLDMYYLSFELAVSLKWREDIARRASIWLFSWRTIGILLYEISGLRWLLFWAPNLFENFFLFYAAAKKYYPEFQIKNGRRLAVILLLLYIPKFFQEYILHVRQEQPVEWIRQTFLPFLPRK